MIVVKVVRSGGKCHEVEEMKDEFHGLEITRHIRKLVKQNVYGHI